jgi:hypothetical protein
MVPNGKTAYEVACSSLICPAGGVIERDRSTGLSGEFGRLSEPGGFGWGSHLGQHPNILVASKTDWP